jgi:hypothetical protein
MNIERSIMSRTTGSKARVSKVAALTGAALTLFSLVLVATPASAADPVSAENFNPDEVVATGGGALAPMVLSDRPDGSSTSDTMAHVTTVTTTEAAVVEYHLCDTFVDDQAGDVAVDPDPNADGDCFKVGEDTTGVIPAPGPAGAGRAFELAFDIPAAQEDLAGTTEFVAYICTSAAARTEANCDSEVEDDIHVDDSSTPANPPAQTSAGEVTFPSHGSSVSNAGFTATASTSPDVIQVIFCIVEETDVTTDAGNADEGADAAGDGDPTQCDTGQLVANPDNPPAQQGTFKTWSAFLDPPDNAEFGVVLFEAGSGPTPGAGLCSGDPDCQLDSHYIVSALSTPTEVKIALDDHGDNCQGTDIVTSDVAIVPFQQSVSGCIFDQSGNDITNNVNWAFQATPDADAGATTVATSGWDLLGGLDGTAFDRNLNNFFEIVNGDANDAGAGDRALQQFRVRAPGSWTLVFCLDSNNDAQPANPAQSSTPCAGETLSATATKEGVEEIDHVHVKKQSETDTLCHTGSSSTTAPAGSVVTLQGCALAVTQTTSNEVPVSDVHVLWIVNPASQPDDPGQIPTQTNTTDGQGHATAQVTSGANAGDKTTTIRFCLDEFPATGGALAGNGICDSFEGGRQADPALQADYQINWTQPAAGGCPNGFNRIRGNNENNLLIGTKDCDRIKARGGDDTSRGKAANDVLNGGKGEDKGNGGPGTDKCVKTEKKRRCEI